MAEQIRANITPETHPCSICEVLLILNSNWSFLMLEAPGGQCLGLNRIATAKNRLLV
ncbi:hypothetical protein SAMN05216312_114230 [Cohnella sp. OV330]|nr:hypothetical protein SAMN05216312_114230 [Cohnella sp. OV330]